MNLRFNYKSNIKNLTISLAALLTGIALTITFFVLYRADILSFDTFLLAEIIAFLLIALGLFGVTAYFTEKFTLKNGIYSYQKSFGRKKIAKANEVAKVTVRAIPIGNNHKRAFIINYCAEDIRKCPEYMIVQVTFLNLIGNKLLSFYDDGTVFSDGKLEESLAAFSIPIEFIDYPSNQ